MSEPSREHLAAIHEVLEDSSVLFDFECAKVAKAILTSTEPAVLDAMQDVLVRAGRLTESREMETFFDGFDQIIRETARTRYVTDWIYPEENDR